jgi:hypothetical protein
VKLCGHGTLASAHVLYENKIVPLHTTIEFVTKSNDILLVSQNGLMSSKHNVENIIEMNFPSYQLEGANIWGASSSTEASSIIQQHILEVLNINETDVLFVGTFFCLCIDVCSNIITLLVLV